MAETSSPIVTLDEAKELLPVAEGVADFDKRLKNLIVTATIQIETALKRKLTKQAHEQFFSSRKTASRELDLVGDSLSSVQALTHDFHESGIRTVTRPQTITLQSFPVDTAQTVELVYDPSSRFDNEDMTGFSETATLIASNNFTVDPDRGTIQIRFPMLMGRRRLRARFTGGFVVAEGTISADLEALGFVDIKQACLWQTVFLFKKTDRSNIGKRTEKAKAGNREFQKTGGLVPEAASLLTPYKAILKGAG